ncbi:glycosyl hydrolase family 3 N terminal domain-containing protein [Aspergillus pseudoustus]|uniref:beta-glucosidase n=1 Tax=Aspergillus pseudoustus TaxID=1810923 RepID=A0ABR4JR61_9EURO
MSKRIGQRLDVFVSERALREIYLKPFEIVVRQAKPWAVMASYNKVNGQHVSKTKELLDGVLRKEWGFDGVVMSDWWGFYSTAASLNATLDLEMPGPAVWRGVDRITRSAAAAEKAPGLLVSFAQGCYSDEMLPLMETSTATGAKGLDIKLFPHPFDFDVDPLPLLAAIVTSENSKMFFFNCLHPVGEPPWA